MLCYHLYEATRGDLTIWWKEVLLLISHIYLTKKKKKKVGEGEKGKGSWESKTEQKGKNLYDEVLGRMKEQKEGFLPVS